MAQSPSTDNYTLGKGVVSFNRLNRSTGLYTGERDLGNAPAFAISLATEKLEHFSSRGGLKAKDKEIISQITPGLTFTLDEINVENLAMLTLASTVQTTQAAGSAVDEVVTAYLGKMVALAHRNIGATTLAHGTVTNGPFVAGETVTGGTSAATGSVIVVGAGYVQVVVTSGTFQNGEAITAATKTANLSAAPVFVPGVIKVTNTAGTTTYVSGTDYSVTEMDAKVGRVTILADGAITEGESIEVTYGYQATTYTTIRAFTETQVEGFLRFVSDNPAGNQRELRVWRVSLTPTGETSFIGDDWSTLGFTGEILNDATNHPESPYLEILEFE